MQRKANSPFTRSRAPKSKTGQDQAIAKRSAFEAQRVPVRNQPGSEQLIALIGAEVNASKALVNALEQEYEALKGRDSERLDQAIAEKQQRTSEVQDATDERSKYVESELGTTNLLDTAFVAPAPVRDRLLVAIGELRQVAEQITVRNQANGRLLAMSQQAAELLLGAMRNEQPTPATYSAQGQLPDTVFSRPLAKA